MPWFFFRPHSSTRSTAKKNTIRPTHLIHAYVRPTVVHKKMADFKSDFKSGLMSLDGVQDHRTMLTCLTHSFHHLDVPRHTFVHAIVSYHCKKSDRFQVWTRAGRWCSRPSDYVDLLDTLWQHHRCTREIHHVGTHLEDIGNTTKKPTKVCQKGLVEL